ncbi:aminoglycoside phosphotransferase family protein [Nocardioides iriomotensis]|uniref:Aminoglycoside phosphotransferase family protein n=1 Tax=Nocardioides iriomotensis TaxID=715784 RepID=A0A4Q5IZV4_9ACTN|nr:aminoglycoside phosphotransferase family protein [Nocardioides iriomotensis]RYU10621.1 aminoglycoside phosphotransferase family protein [Nocardioides iriomotensis]
MPVDLWSSTAFHEEARAWVQEQARPLGIRLTGAWEQPHNRPWSSAMSFESDAGRLWFKVNGPGIRFEAALVDLLGKVVPDLVPEVLAADHERAWSLTRDAGPTLRSVAPPEELWAWWEGIVVRYAEAQLVLADHRDAMLAAGVSEASPATLPAQTRALVEELAARTPDDGGLTREEVAGLEALLPEYDAWCAALAASGVPDSAQHDDLHSSNICWTGAVETARVIDWGDTSVGSPIATMLCTMNSLAFHAGCEVDDPRVLRVRDAYLEPFTAYADRAELVELVTLARRTGAVTRAMSYQHAFHGEPRSAEAEMDWPVRGWLLELHEL